MAAAARAQPAYRPAAPHLPALLIGAIVLAAVAGAGLSQILQTGHAAALRADLRALEQERTALGAEVRLLEADVATMLRSGEPGGGTAAQLGLVTPKQTVRIAINVAAPAVLPLPGRYVETAPAPVPEAPAWWERALRALSGFR